MIKLALALWLCLAAPVAAATVTVKSGEHEGFTRLVLDFGSAVNWKVGRTTDGYELHISDANLTYDLSQVFDIIGKSRLAAIWADPETTALRVGIACACHAIPFEFRPGIIVVDLRDGPPPKGSSFELALNGSDAPALANKPVRRPRARPDSATAAYDWTDLALAQLPRGPVEMVQIVPSSDPALEPLRYSLLQQLSRGAAQGMVDLALPVQAKSPSLPTAKVPSVRVGLGDLPGLTVGSGLPDHSNLAADGEACVASASLDIAAWGSDAPISEQMAGAMANLLGEFDKPNTVALQRAVQFHLFMGFGAETLHLLRAFPADLPEVAMWRSLASVLDGIPDPEPVFLGQSACNSAAALWSVLTDPAPIKGVDVNRDAVMLAFSSLPIALRRHLGPVLVDRFLAMEDAESAGAIRNAILRAPGKSGPAVDLLEAEMDLKSGNAAAAEARLEKLLADPGPATPAALVALVVARVAQDLPIDTALVEALDALVTEQSGSAAESETRFALTLAQAASGDFDSAFAALPQSPKAAADVWRLLAKLAVDESLLAHAVLDQTQATPDLPTETTAALAERLLGFGLAEAAQRWIDPAADVVLVAKAQLARRDANAALRSLSDIATPEALALRAEAMRIVGDEDQAQAYLDAGDAEGQRLALSRSRDWLQLAQLQPDGWGPALAALDDSAADAVAGPLAQGHFLASRSTATRAAVAELLAMVATPMKSAP